MNRKALLAILATVLVLGAGGEFFLLAPLLLKNRLSSAISRVTGMPCSIRSLRKTGAARFEVGNLELGAAPGPVVEVDRLSAEGDPWHKELSSLAISKGTVQLWLPGLPHVRISGVDLQARNLGALSAGGPGGAASLVASGDCLDLNPILRERSRSQFLRGRFTLSCELSRPPDGRLDAPITVLLENFLVRSLDGKFQGESGSAETVVRLTGTPGNLQLDASNLAPFLGRDISQKRR